MEDFDRSQSRERQFSVTDGPPSEAIVDAVATVKDISPMECPPLYETVDTDAIDDIFDDGDEGSVTFFFADCTVTLRANDCVIVEEHE